MKERKAPPVTINSISELHHIMGYDKPEHPLISVTKHTNEPSMILDGPISFIANFYIVMMKSEVNGKLKYGQNYYDFDEGILAMLAPGQVLSIDNGQQYSGKGWLLAFHPDFVRNYPLSKTIKNYGFFAYNINEALHLSKKEEKMMEGIMKHIQKEYNSSIDQFSHDVMISHLDLLLNYSNRFYNRQFLTRKSASSNQLVKLDDLLTDYFRSDKIQKLGLPPVHYISDKLNVSANYLSDMLRSLTGQSTQQHIHNKLIEVAKESLTTTQLSVSEIAYQLGFEHPQSFNKLFKSKTNLSPLEFRSSFN
ncbi:AraC family transcriptional regulator [Sphingobacteriaceae bacterium]|nr:AraC family transcriptional regulator [Sphingobacteriaceae bacterium]